LEKKLRDLKKLFTCCESLLLLNSQAAYKMKKQLTAFYCQ